MPYAIGRNGAAFGWGRNAWGCVGDFSRSDRSFPVLVVGNHSFIAIDSEEEALGDTFTLACKANGEVWTWGSNSSGQLGVGATGLPQSSPVLVVGAHSFIAISGGATHALAMKANGEAWGWGLNSSGELGDQTKTGRNSPVLVVGGHSFIGIAAAYAFSLALKATGEVWSWGHNAYGQLGDQTRVGKSTPVLVVGSHSFVEISASGDYSLARKANGEVWAWGSNSSGQLGDGSATSASSPVLVVGAHSFVEISAGDSFVLARKANGEVWSWGWNGSGQLGDQTTTSRTSPVLVVGSHSFVGIKTYDATALARKANGEVWAWGYNGYGQLGIGSLSNASSPVLVVGGPIYAAILTTSTPLSAVCWGEENPTDGETTKSWRFCMLGDGRDIPVEGDPYWGKARIFESDAVVTEVVDLGNATEKILGLTRNRYGTGDSPTLYIRGSAVQFGPYDGSPSWVLYEAPVSQAWQYVQVKIEASV